MLTHGQLWHRQRDIANFRIMDNPKITQLKADFRAFRDALESESDRGCALFAAAYLDDALAALLRTCLRNDKRITEDLFKNHAPLSSFSARIKVAYYLGAIDEKQRKNLDSVRDIRNRFAHHPQLVSFSDQSINDRCGNLDYEPEPPSASARDKFITATAGLLGYMQGMMVKFSEMPGVKIAHHLHDVSKDL